MQLFGTKNQVNNTNMLLNLPKISQGDNLLVDGPFSFDGNAKLKVYNANKMQFDINVKAEKTIMGIEVKSPYLIKEGQVNIGVALTKNPDNTYTLSTIDNNNPSYQTSEIVTSSEKSMGSKREITFSSNNVPKSTFLISQDGTIVIKPIGIPFSVTMSKSGYSQDNYNTSPYGSGYSQGASGMMPVAQGMSSLTNGVGSMASSVGGIFSTILGLMANILNTIANLMANLVTGVLGLFGVGKKDKDVQKNTNSPTMNNNFQNNQVNLNQQNTQNSQTDTNKISASVNQDLGNVRDKKQAMQIISLHAKRAKDARANVESLLKESEKESKNLLTLTQSLQKNPKNTNLINKMNISKNKSMELLKNANVLSKSVYEESLYVQMAKDVLSSKFPSNSNQDINKISQDTMKNWSGNSNEKGLFTKNIKPMPEILNSSNNIVNNNIALSTQIVSKLPVQR